MGEMNFKNRGELVYETLKQEILDLRLKPGQMISENDICERFGVSRTPVRDALRLLQEQGFAETIPYRGTYVTLLSLDNIKQMIYMRVAVETMVLRDFLEIQTPMVIEDIRHSIAQQRLLSGNRDLSRSSFTVWTRRCTPSGLRPSGVRSCGRCSRRSSSTIPDSGCWTSSRKLISCALSVNMRIYSA